MMLCSVSIPFLLQQKAIYSTEMWRLAPKSVYLHIMEIEIDTAVRLMGVGASLLLLIIVLAGRVREPLKIILAGLIVGGAAYLINTSEQLDISGPFKPPLDLISLITPFWIWLFARLLFERRPPHWLLGLVLLLYLIGWGSAHYVAGGEDVGFYIIHLLSLVVVADLIYVALSGLGDDLVRKRRLVRIYLPLLVAIQTGGILVYEMIFRSAAVIPAVQLANAILILTLFLFGGLALLQTDPELLVREDNDEPKSENETGLSPSETVLSDNLTEEMDNGRYRESGLTIKTLAAHLDTPEHRLRSLINQKLGHRNFSSFLNQYRIGEAKKKLSSRDHVDIPILTIAMDLGYNSLAPFNRAFRSETGQTPSDFRKSSIDQK